MNVFTLLAVADPEWTDDLRQTLFAREGMRIVCADSVKEAQQKARFAPPQLVLMKRNLQDGNGDDLCRWFRLNLDLKNARLVVMLEEENLAEAQRSRDAGADQVIVRPRSPEALTPLVAKMLDAPLRNEIRVPVEIRVEGEVAAGALQGLTRNLSLGGALLEVSGADCTKGDMVYVRLHPHGVSSPIVAKAEVVRVIPQQIASSIGVRFLRFDRDGRARLEQFLSTQDLV